MNSEFALALHAMILMVYSEQELLTSSALSEKLNVHPVRIRKILALLKKNGLIESREGIHGGFSLNCNPDKVTLKEIYNITQKDVLKPRCHDCSKHCRIGANIENVLIQIFEKADENVQDFLEEYTLRKVVKMIG
ncbi:MAG TPA: Rrf2 family transcriptional regulator [Spirochaetota bacterium]